MEEGIKLLLIDNFDSFTYNLVHLIEGLGVKCNVVRNDELNELETSDYSHLIIGPGPGLPADSNGLSAFMHRWRPDKPMLGVCLGMQVMLEDQGRRMININPVHHGSQDKIKQIKPSRLFKGIDESIRVGRYHSWGFNFESDYDPYTIVAVDDSNLVMAVEHQLNPWFGLQFHPESIMTQNGKEIIQNFLQTKNQ